MGYSHTFGLIPKSPEDISPLWSYVFNSSTSHKKYNIINNYKTLYGGSAVERQFTVVSIGGWYQSRSLSLWLWVSLTFVMQLVRYEGIEGIQGRAFLTILKANPILIASTLSHPWLAKCKPTCHDLDSATNLFLQPKHIFVYLISLTQWALHINIFIPGGPILSFHCGGETSLR